MEDNLRFAAEAGWKLAIAALVLGAGLPALFAVGVRAWATGDTVSPDGTVARSQPRPIGATALGAVCFLVVLVAIGYGITYLVATGGGHKVSFSHGYPRVYDA
jgi:hypothetical protein